MLPSDVIFWEFVGSLFGFFVLISLFGGLGIGYVFGYGQYGIIGLIILCPMVWLCQGVLVFGFDPGIQQLSNISRSGVQRGVDWILYAHILVHPLVVVVGLLLGRRKRKREILHIRSSGMKLTADDIYGMLNVLSNHPQLASAGWFASNWQNKGQAEQRAWVNQHAVELRQIWIDGFELDEVGGFDAYDIGLPGKLAAIDQSIGAPKSTAVTFNQRPMSVNEQTSKGEIS